MKTIRPDFFPGDCVRRYRRQDEAGTPFGLTTDFETLGEKGPELKDTVTLREPRQYETGAGPHLRPRARAVGEDSLMAADAETGTAAFIKKRAPTLYVIIAIKLGKGFLLLLLGLGVYTLSDNNLPQQFRETVQFFHLDPDRKFFTILANRIAQVTPANVIWVARGTLLYSLSSLVEGAGLIFRVPWAGWMAIGESMFFIPIEVHELMKGFSLSILAVLVINVGIVSPVLDAYLPSRYSSYPNIAFIRTNCATCSSYK